MKTTYRPDIDGLRAIAVLAVVAFHGFPGAMPGGFIGVDVFFVISGFLITGIIHTEHRDNRFSFARFYSRRVRRLFPALLLVLSACLVVGWFFLLPDEYRRLGRHTTAGAAFSANIVFWREAGYFDTESELKPLLHLWSLGIEEQFYFVWPVVLALLVRLRTRVLPWLAVIAVISFATNVYLRGTLTAFYLPIPRFWELLVGAALAIAPPRVHARAASLLGAAALLAGMLLIDQSTPFPGVWVLLPVGGTALLIAAGENGMVNEHVLSRRWLVWVGLISYPLYLWHWPLLAFARTYYFALPPVVVRVALVALSVPLAYVTYRWVERPLRFSHPGSRVPLILCAGLIGVASLGMVVLRRGGFPHRYGNAADDLVHDRSDAPYLPCPTGLASASPALHYCFQSQATPATSAIIGDSHADHIFAGVVTADRETSWLEAGHPSCPPVAGISVHYDSDRCQERSEHILKYLLATPAVKTVVLAYFSGYVQTTPYAAQHVASGAPVASITSSTATGSKRELMYQGLGRVIAELERAGKQVVLLQDIPELPFVPHSCLPRASFLPAVQRSCVLERDAVLARQRMPREIIRDLQQAHPRLLVYDPLDTLCTATHCPVEDGDHLLYRDSHHLSVWGSAKLARAFLPWLRAHAP